MTRVIVHAGFHKTGTTSLQAFVETNREALRPWADVYLKRDLGRARYLGRLYGQRPWLARRLAFRHGFRAFLAGIPDARTIFISRESLSGMMPGNRRRRLPWRGGRGERLVRYERQAIALGHEMTAALRRRFGDGARIEFLFTTRKLEPWIYSLYRHILRTSALNDDFARFRADFAATPPLAEQARNIARALPGTVLHISALECARERPLGHGAMLLDLLGVPATRRARFRDAGHHHAGPSQALAERFLEMNRRTRPGRALKEAKRTLYQREQDRQRETDKR